MAKTFWISLYFSSQIIIILVVSKSYMKHANPSTIDPKEDDTSSMLTPNCSDRSTKAGLTKGPSAPSRDAPNVLDNNIGQLEGSFGRQDNVQCPETCFLFPTGPVQSMLIMIKYWFLKNNKHTDHLGHRKVAVWVPHEHLCQCLSWTWRLLLSRSRRSQKERKKFMLEMSYLVTVDDA